MKSCLISIVTNAIDGINIVVARFHLGMLVFLLNHDTGAPRMFFLKEARSNRREQGLGGSSSTE